MTSGREHVGRDRFQMDAGSGERHPTLAWSERDLVAFLADAWQQDSVHKLQVVGTTA